MWQESDATNLTLQDETDAYAMVISHEMAEMVVDPKVDGQNPEVCDPCDINCNNLTRVYFDASDNHFLGVNRASPPGGFAYDYYICAVVKSEGSANCPAAAADWQYAALTPIHTALTVDKDGKMNVAWLDLSDPSKGWHAPVAFGDARLVPGAPVSVFQQSATVYTALTVGRPDPGDNYGKMNVAWLDLSDPSKGWHAPVAFGDARLVPGAPVSVFQQSATVYTALTVDKDGKMNVAWLDLSDPSKGWHAPVAFGDARLVPGAPVSVFQQSATVYTALTVDKDGKMNVAWLDLSDPSKGWHAPVAFGDARLAPGAPVSVFQQSATVYTVLTVDKDGKMNVAWLDLSDPSKGWHAPVAFGDARLAPGAPVSVFQQSATVYTVLTVDKDGKMNVAWLDLGDPSKGWHAPVAFGNARLVPGAPVSVFQQSATVYTALTVDKDGKMNVAWLDLSDPSKGWHAPVAFGDARLAPGAPVSVFQQSATVYTALTVDKDGKMNVAWLDLSDPSKGWHAPVAFGDARLAMGAAVSVFQQV